MEQELQEFKEFKKNYQFKQKEIIEDEQGNLYCEELLLKDEKGYVGETNKWINVGYNIHGSYTKLLSNLFPYEFDFRGYHLHSIESFFQGIKFKDKDLQKQIFNYSGIPAVVIKDTSDYNWKETGIIYFQGEPIKRDSKEYDDIIDELYISAIQNPFYRNAIKKCPQSIIHAIGKQKKEETVFTRYEFEYMLNALHSFLNK